MSYVVSAYTSAPAIEATLRALAGRLDGRDAEVIVVENGSTDGTGALLERIQRTWAHPGVSLRVLRSEMGMGDADRAASPGVAGPGRPDRRRPAVRVRRPRRRRGGGPRRAPGGHRGQGAPGLRRRPRGAAPGPQRGVPGAASRRPGDAEAGTAGDVRARRRLGARDRSPARRARLPGHDGAVLPHRAVGVQPLEVPVRLSPQHCDHRSRIPCGTSGRWRWGCWGSGVGTRPQRGDGPRRQPLSGRASRPTAARRAPPRGPGGPGRRSPAEIAGRRRTRGSGPARAPAARRGARGTGSR
jgi:dolichyl-phosphate beta-glucosyltransferase